MPVSPTYPGVYIEEIPSGVHTITGVPTSISAFLGRAISGPVNTPTIINSFGDFESTFGGLGVNYPMSYAVRDFYLNGGSQGVIVRLYEPDGAKPTKALLKVNGLNLEASSEGSWANTLRVRVDNKVSSDVATALGLTPADLFNLTAHDTNTGETEKFLNLSGKESARRVDRLLLNNSSLIRVQAGLVAPFTVPTPHADPHPGDDIWAKDTLSTPVLAADQVANGLALKDATYEGDQNAKTGIFALENTDIFNILCIPPDTRDTGSDDTSAAVYQAAMSYCVGRRAMLIVDSPDGWLSANDIVSNKKLDALGLTGPAARNAAIYFPRVIESDPLRSGQPDTFVACGMLAGIWARTDVARGVWKAPAGLDATLNGIQGLAITMTDAENGMLNPLGINCLRSFPVNGRVVWGGRTLRGADVSADDYKYIPVRRLALYIEESLYRGTQWVVFEPNDNPLWAQIRLNVGAFMHNLFRQGAFQGKTPQEAYFVKCDNETTTQNDINLGIVNIVVGFAPLKPAEFVIIQIQQIAGDIQT
jgi:phage tail sheath protein FI